METDEFVPDELIPDSEVKSELGGISTMTLWRWDHDADMIALGLPPAIRIGRGKSARKYRSRRQLEKFKAEMLRRALDERSHRSTRKYARGAGKAEANP